MGITLKQVNSLAGGIQEGYMQGQSNRRDNAENVRDQAGEDRTARDDAFSQTYNQSLSERGEIWARWQNSGGQTPPAEQAGAGASGIPMPGGDPVAAAATPAAPNIQAPALPTQEGAAPAAPAPDDSAPSQYDSYREEMAAWNRRTEAMASKMGGLKGLTMHRDNEDALNRKQMNGHISNAILAMNNSSDAGAAAKELNTAMSISPEDLGMKFRADNGKLYLTGKDGKLGEPYDRDSLMELQRQYMTTPENYKDMQAIGMKEREVSEAERAKLEAEEIAKQKADAGDITAAASTVNAAANASNAESNAALVDSRQVSLYAGAYKDLAAGKEMTADAIAKAGGHLAWTTANIREIEKMDDKAAKGRLGYSGAWTSEEFGNSELFNSAIGGAKEIRFLNDPIGITDNQAAVLSRMAYFNELDTGPDGKYQLPPGMAGLIVEHDSDTGRYSINFENKTIMLPATLGIKINKNLALIPEGK